MNAKRISGIVILVIGVVLIAFSFYIKSRVAETRQNMRQGSSYMPQNPVSQGIGGAIRGATESKLKEYDTLALWCQYGGIALIVIGAGVSLCCRKKK